MQRGGSRLRTHTFVMCLELGQGVHSHLAQCTVEQALSLLLFFLATPGQGGWGWSSPFALGYTLSRLWNTGRGWGARLFLWGSWSWTQAILHGNCLVRNMGSSQMALHVQTHPHFLECKSPGVSPHPVTTAMFSCPGPQPNSIQLPLAGCVIAMPGLLPQS